MLASCLLISSCSDQFNSEEKREIQNKSHKLIIKQKNAELTFFPQKNSIKLLSKKSNDNSHSLKIRKNKLLNLSGTHGGTNKLNSFSFGVKPGFYGPVNVSALETNAYTLITTEEQRLAQNIGDYYLYSVFLWDVEDSDEDGSYTESDATDKLCLINSNTVNITFPSTSIGKTYILFYVIYEPVPEDIAQTECRINLDKYILVNKTIHVAE